MRRTTNKKWLFFYTVLIGICIQSFTQEADEPGKGRLIVPVANIRQVNQGKLIVMVFLKKKRINCDPQSSYAIETLVPAGPSTEVLFDDLDYGDYAVCVFHDMDGDRKVRTNFIGIPREDMGSSQNASGGPLGGPKWEKTKFTHQNSETKITPINLYPFYK